MSSISDYKVASRTTDATSNETSIDFPNFTKYYGYYRQIPELKKAIDTLATWVVRKGFETDKTTKIRLERLPGHGKDTFIGILFNLFVVMKVNGDAFAEIIEDDSRLLNLKPLSPENVRIWQDPQGMIVRYEHRQLAGEWKNIPKEKMFHLVNDRVANEPRGTSIIEACKWVIDARNEAMSDWRRLLHRSTIRIIEVDSDDSAKLAQLKQQYKTAIEKGEALIVPRGNVGFPEATISNINPEEWIQYLENFFYQAVGVPRVIATSENYTEAASKVGYLTFEPIYTGEQGLLEEQLWSQLAIRLTFNKPPSLMQNAQKDEAANTGQTGFQQNDVQAGSGAG